MAELACVKHTQTNVSGIIKKDNGKRYYFAMSKEDNKKQKSQNYYK
jgi:hypothetical protein